MSIIVVTRGEQYIINGERYFEYPKNKQLFAMNIENNSKTDLIKLAKFIGLKNVSIFKKDELIDAIRLYIIFEM